MELSGIGRPDILEKFGIDVNIELPGVGENLQEHIGGRLVQGMCVYVPDVVCPFNLLPEIRDDYELDTLELLRDPEQRKKQLELQ